jgi:perosamine synthetase
MEKIPITRPLFDQEEEKSILESLRSGWVVQGPKVAEFERLFAEYTGAKHAIATTSCTTALHLALIAAGVNAGDEVIVPAFTWIATANVVEYVGAKPIFCDIDLATYNIDVEQIETKITEKTKAIIPVHLFGLCADMDPIMELARRHDLQVVEDAACALGAWYGDRHAGTFGTAGCFSFHPRKAITTGEGGILITDDDEVAGLCRALRDHGASVSDLARHEGKRAFLLTEFNVLGFNYRMTDIQGAMAVAQMGKLKSILEARSARAERYNGMLEDAELIQLPAVPEGCAHGYQSYVCLLQAEQPDLDNVVELHEKRNQLMENLEDQGISTRQGTHSVHMLGYYRIKYGMEESDFPRSFSADKLTLTLPLYPQMTDAEQERVVQSLKRELEDL